MNDVIKIVSNFFSLFLISELVIVPRMLLPQIRVTFFAALFLIEKNCKQLRCLLLGDWINCGIFRNYDNTQCLK